MESSKKINAFRGKKLKNLRVEANLHQTELAERAGVSKQFISQIEQGKPFSLKVGNALAKIFNVDVFWLMEDEFAISTYKKHKEMSLPKAKKAVTIEEMLVLLQNQFEFFEERVVGHFNDLSHRMEDIQSRLEKLEQNK